MSHTWSYQSLADAHDRLWSLLCSDADHDGAGLARARDLLLTARTRLDTVLEYGAMGAAFEYLVDTWSKLIPWRLSTAVPTDGAGELVEFDRFANVKRVLDAFVQRPAVQAGLAIPKRD